MGGAKKNQVQHKKIKELNIWVEHQKSVEPKKMK